MQLHLLKQRGEGGCKQQQPDAIRKEDFIGNIVFSQQSYEFE